MQFKLLQIATVLVTVLSPINPYKGGFEEDDYHPRRIFINYDYVNSDYADPGQQWGAPPPPPPQQYQAQDVYLQSVNTNTQYQNGPQNINNGGGNLGGFNGGGQAAPRPGPQPPPNYGPVQHHPPQPPVQQGQRQPAWQGPQNQQYNNGPPNNINNPNINYGQAHPFQNQQANNFPVPPTPKAWPNNKPSDSEPPKDDKKNSYNSFIFYDPNESKSPGYKPTLPPPPPSGYKSYWDYKEENAKNWQNILDKANDRVKSNPFAPPVPPGKYVSAQERYQLERYPIQRREDMERSGELAIVPPNFYREPLKYVDRNFKFMEVEDPNSKFSEKHLQVQQNSKKVPEDPTSLIEWSKFTRSCSLSLSFNVNFASSAIFIIIYFIL
ncbi:formin-like protein 20 [Folsomia candida]|uniref:formin-like protein 20 n=1 Tax=Folsomia candida TaxID=158441 RepID=UPI0016055900|nr:formin-like protein 20 [Folsomia candida]